MPCPIIADSDDDSPADQPQNNEAEKTTKKRSKRTSESTEDTSESEGERKQCLAVSKYIPHGLDAFCNLQECMQVCLLLEQTKEYDSEEAIPKPIQALLSKVNDETRQRYQRTFDYLTIQASYLLSLVGDSTKSAHLTKLVKEMKGSIMHIRSEDGCCLCKMVSQYAAPNPKEKVVTPPVCPKTKGGHARMEFNHPHLGRMLCPVKYLKGYIEDENGMRKKFQEPSDPMKVTSKMWPAYLYLGDTPGSEYNPKAIGKGLFRGYLMEHISPSRSYSTSTESLMDAQTLKHVFMSPSSALEEHAKGAKGSNAKIHGMKVVKPEHIAYAAMQARFTLSSAEKWADQDSLFNYQEYYYQIICLICETKDRVWAEELLCYYNEKLFGNSKGLTTTDSAAMGKDDDDDLLEMERQFEAHEFADVAVAPDTSAIIQDKIQETDNTTGEPSHMDKPFLTRTTIQDEAEQTNDLAQTGEVETWDLPPPQSPAPSTTVASSLDLSTIVGSVSPRPGPTTILKRKQVDVLNLFNDDGPLTEDKDGVHQEPPAKKKRGHAATRKAPARAKSAHAKK